MSGWGSHKIGPRRLKPLGPPPPQVQISVRMSPNLIRAIKLHCVETEQTMTKFIIDALAAKLK